jgi:non-specific serine/threonine protein kinase/serine/threonine-protein kinase
VTPDYWKKIETLFHRAIAFPTRDRAEFLEEACEHDPKLGSDVRELVEECNADSSFLELPALQVAARQLTDASPDGSSDDSGAVMPAPALESLWTQDRRHGIQGKRIGPYQVLRSIGHGGMGTVYLAARADDQYHKQVAIKMIRCGIDGEPVLRRFRNERQILANLDHPNIAKLLDGGTTQDGLPYLVMEYIEGRPIDEYCNVHQLSIGARLSLFQTVCLAVHYAHQNLVIHRDIKPSNILVNAEGVPKLLDFGIAKLLNPDVMFEAGETTVPMMQPMTPDYASPEQTRGEPISTVSDVYSIGVLLYELLAGCHPYGKTRTRAEIARMVCEQEPEKPSAKAPDHVRRKLAGDLDNIILMAMRKLPERRYASTQQLYEDIRRHLNGLPVIARKDTFSYRTGKFVKRNKSGMIAAALIVAALLTGLVSTAWQARIAGIQKAQTQAQKAKADQRLDDALKLTGSLLFDYQDEISKLPGSTVIRSRLIGNTLDYLDQLAREVGDNLPLQGQLAAAYLKIGDVQGKPYAANRGDTAKALLSYRHAVTLLETVSKANPLDEQIRLELSNGYDAIGGILSRLVDYDRSIESQRKALAIRERLSQAHPENPQYRRLVAASCISLGDVSNYNGDLSASFVLYHRALEILQKVSMANPSDLQLRREFGNSHRRVAGWFAGAGGWISRNLSPLPEVQESFRNALKHYRIALEIGRELAGRDPRDAGLRRAVADVAVDTAVVLGNTGDTAAGLKLLHQSISIFGELSAADPANVESRMDLLVSYRNTGMLLENSGDSAGALRYYKMALHVNEELCAEDPSNQEARVFLNASYWYIFRLPVENDGVKDAIRYFRNRLKKSEASASTSTPDRSPQSDASENMLTLSGYLAKSGQDREADGLTARALEIQKAEVDRPQTSSIDLTSFAIRLLAWKPRDLGILASALEYANRAVERSQAKDPYALRTLAMARYMSRDDAGALDSAYKMLALLPNVSVKRDSSGLLQIIDTAARRHFPGRMACTRPLSRRN